MYTFLEAFFNEKFLSSAEGVQYFFLRILSFITLSSSYSSLCCDTLQNVIKAKLRKCSTVHCENQKHNIKTLK